MIRRVELQDAKAITTIYNEYVEHSVATFETEPLREDPSACLEQDVKRSFGKRI